MRWRLPMKGQVNKMTQKITCWVNGKKQCLEVDPGESLLEMLRNRLFLMGTKKGCGVGECGACTVIVDDYTVDSCIYLASRVDGKSIRTIEGESKDGEISSMQRSFLDHNALQCGFCTPGFVMQATWVKENKDKLSRDEIRRMLAGNLCRCTGYQSIIDAVEDDLKK